MAIMKQQFHDELTGPTYDTHEAVVCGNANCRRVFGYELELHGVVFLCMVEGLIVSAAHGVCVSCGAEFHWSSKDVRLAGEIRKSILKKA